MADPVFPVDHYGPKDYVAWLLGGAVHTPSLKTAATRAASWLLDQVERGQLQQQSEIRTAFNAFIAGFRRGLNDQAEERADV